MRTGIRHTQEKIATFHVRVIVVRAVAAYSKAMEGRNDRRLKA
jgi:hypothetical protein